MSDVIFVLRLVEDEARVSFIDGVIGQMHRKILQVVVLRLFVRVSRETREPLSVHKDFEGTDALQQHVDAKVKL